MKIMGFCPKMVWVMGVSQDYGFWVRNSRQPTWWTEKLWVFGGYGLSQVWVMTGSTVLMLSSINRYESVRSRPST